MPVYDAKVIVCDNCAQEVVVAGRKEATQLKLPEGWKRSATGMYLWCPACAVVDGKLRVQPDDA